MSEHEVKHPDPSELLPIGSVVRTKGADTDLMIVGILTNKENVLYDYIGVLHPEGYLDQEHFYLFNHEELEKIEYIGYINAAYQIFRGRLKKYNDQKDQASFE